MNTIRVQPRFMQRAIRKWVRMYRRCQYEETPFRTIIRRFAFAHGFWPNADWPLMPKEPLDQWRLIVDVSEDRLHPEETYEAYASARSPGGASPG